MIDPTDVAARQTPEPAERRCSRPMVDPADVARRKSDLGAPQIRRSRAANT
jgi:hypothetical protein